MPIESLVKIKNLSPDGDKNWMSVAVEYDFYTEYNDLGDGAVCKINMDALDLIAQAIDEMRESGITALKPDFACTGRIGGAEPVKSVDFLNESPICLGRGVKPAEKFAEAQDYDDFERFNDTLYLHSDYGIEFKIYGRDSSNYCQAWLNVHDLQKMAEQVRNTPERTIEILDSSGEATVNSWGGVLYSEFGLKNLVYVDIPNYEKEHGEIREVQLSQITHATSDGEIVKSSSPSSSPKA